jgi:translation initiation factor 2B subunit (eIF-2B alpha/beta/delta family)
MSKFITRVELHDAGHEDYAVLHASMKAEGFERTIRASDGTTYHLPTAEYYREDTVTRSQALDAAKRAAAKTKKRFSVIVTEAIASTWDGLAVV